MPILILLCCRAVFQIHFAAHAARSVLRWCHMPSLWCFFAFSCLRWRARCCRAFSDMPPSPARYAAARLKILCAAVLLRCTLYVIDILLSCFTFFMFDIHVVVRCWGFSMPYYAAYISLRHWFRALRFIDFRYIFHMPLCHILRHTPCRLPFVVAFGAATVCSLLTYYICYMLISSWCSTYCLLMRYLFDCSMLLLCPLTPATFAAATLFFAIFMPFRYTLIFWLLFRHHAMLAVAVFFFCCPSAFRLFRHWRLIYYAPEVFDVTPTIIHAATRLSPPCYTLFIIHFSVCHFIRYDIMPPPPLPAIIPSWCPCHFRCSPIFLYAMFAFVLYAPIHISMLRLLMLIRRYFWGCLAPVIVYVWADIVYGATCCYAAISCCHACLIFDLLCCIIPVLLVHYVAIIFRFSSCYHADAHVIWFRYWLFWYYYSHFITLRCHTWCWCFRRLRYRRYLLLYTLDMLFRYLMLRFIDIRCWALTDAVAMFCLPCHIVVAYDTVISPPCCWCLFSMSCPLRLSPDAIVVCFRLILYAVMLAMPTRSMVAISCLRYNAYFLPPATMFFLPCHVLLIYTMPRYDIDAMLIRHYVCLCRVYIDMKLLDIAHVISWRFISSSVMFVAPIFLLFRATCWALCLAPAFVRCSDALPMLSLRHLCHDCCWLLITLPLFRLFFTLLAPRAHFHADAMTICFIAYIISALYAACLLLLKDIPFRWYMRHHTLRHYAWFIGYAFFAFYMLLMLFAAAAFAILLLWCWFRCLIYASPTFRHFRCFVMPYHMSLILAFRFACLSPVRFFCRRLRLICLFISLRYADVLLSRSCHYAYMPDGCWYRYSLPYSVMPRLLPCLFCRLVHTHAVCCYLMRRFVVSFMLCRLRCIDACAFAMRRFSRYAHAYGYASLFYRFDAIISRYFLLMRYAACQRFAVRRLAWFLRHYALLYDFCDDIACFDTRLLPPLLCCAMAAPFSMFFMMRQDAVDAALRHVVAAIADACPDAHAIAPPYLRVMMLIFTRLPAHCYYRCCALFLYLRAMPVYSICLMRIIFQSCAPPYAAMPTRRVYVEWLLWYAQPILIRSVLLSFKIDIIWYWYMRRAHAMLCWCAHVRALIFRRAWAACWYFVLLRSPRARALICLSWYDAFERILFLPTFTRCHIDAFDAAMPWCLRRCRLLWYLLLMPVAWCPAPWCARAYADVAMLRRAALLDMRAAACHVETPMLIFATMLFTLLIYVARSFAVYAIRWFAYWYSPFDCCRLICALLMRLPW